jgi:hypothetical protein
MGLPTLAIILQKWRIPSDRSIEYSAVEAAERLEQKSPQIIEYTIKGNVAKSWLAPTAIAFVGDLFVLFHSNENFAVYIFMLAGFALALALIVINASSGPTYEFAIKRYRKFWRTRSDIKMLSVGPIHLVEASVYLLNFVLIIVSIFVFLIQPRQPLAVCADKLNNGHSSDELRVKTSTQPLTTSRTVPPPATLR